VHLSLSLGYPIFSRSWSMRTGKDRVQVEATNCAVNIGDARVDAGDLLRGDADGVIAIPKAYENAVLSIAEEIDAVEARILSAVKDGMPLVDARREYGYHQLQTKR
jgi:regulator of RNase E activity RraA